MTHTRTTSKRSTIKIALSLLILLSSFSFATDETYTLHIAVASNFHATLHILATQYQKDHPTKISLSAGATGQLASQIKQGAPYDIFFAADEHTPKQLHQQQLGRSVLPYAQGELWWTDNQPSKDNNCEARITHAVNTQQRIGIANATLAPYGRAAQETLQALQLNNNAQLIRANNISQVSQWLYSGQLEHAFIAGSQRQQTNAAQPCLIPDKLYAPILQSVIILNSAPKQAEDFVLYVMSQTEQWWSQQGYKKTNNAR